MNKCSPVEMRKNLDAVEQFKVEGIDFVPVPAKNAAHKKELVAQAHSVFNDLIVEANTKQLI